MALSSQAVTSDGTLAALDITIAYQNRADIQVFFDDSRVFLAEGKWAWVGSTDNRITFTPAVALGVEVKVKRVTSISEMRHDFTDGAQFVSQSLDENFVQLLQVTQEIQENGTTGGGGGGGDIVANQVGFTPVNGMVSTNVQSAIAELEADIPDPAIQQPKPNGVAAQIGTSERYALEDHVHPGGGGGGGEGTPGLSNGLVYAYKRGVSLPVDNPGEVVYNFSVAKITFPNGDALANGWTKTIPPGTDQLYLAVASASSSDNLDTIAANEWAEPVLFVANGEDGANGLNTATVLIYQRTATNTPPALPTSQCTYQFAPPALSGLNGGWSTTIPGGSGMYLYASTATAVSATSTDMIAASEWATPNLLAKDGVQGAQGPSGTGTPGQRGSLTIYAGGYASWSDSAAYNAVLATGYGTPINRDTVTLYGSGFSQTRFYDFGSWVILNAVIDGNLLVSGTVSASKVSGGILQGVSIYIGTGNGPNGRSFEVTNTGVTWIEFIAGKSAYFDNLSQPSYAAVQAYTSGSSPKAGIEGAVAGSNSNSGTAGIYGRSLYSGTGGLVGPNGFNFDFYGIGSGASIGPFTGAHDALVLPGSGLVAGDIVVDKMCIIKSSVSNTLFEVVRSSVPNQKACIGVVSRAPTGFDWNPTAFTLGWDADGYNVHGGAEYDAAKLMYHTFAMNSVGEGQVNVVGEGGTIEAGDLIVTSSVPGKGMRQADDIVRGYTVAKAREGATFTGDEVKQIACIYLCG